MNIKSNNQSSIKLNIKRGHYLFCLLLMITSCDTFQSDGNKLKDEPFTDTLTSDVYKTNELLSKEDSILKTRSSKKVINFQGGNIDTKNISPDEVVAFAETLLATPYVYGSSDPAVGFDCSGFITYVFNYFNIAVPRSSKDFISSGKTVPFEHARRGDLILFTDPGVDNVTSPDAGHMGLITSNENNVISFIHSTSGKAMAVVITAFNEHYEKRFLRIARIFP